MKKTLFTLFAFTFALAFVACQKEQTVINNTDNPGTNPPATPTEPTYQEGVYAPLMKIASLNYDDESVQTWTWDGEQLVSVQGENGDSRQFTYSNGRIASVSGTIGDLMGIISGISGTVSFTYNGTLLKDCTANSDGTDILLALFNHADNRISSVDAAVDADYISSMLNGMIHRGGERKYVDPKQIKLTAEDSSIHADFVWTGKNITRMTTQGSIPFGLSKETYETLKPYMPIDSAMLRLIDMYFMVSNSLPLVIDIADTMDFTYDTKINPFYCYLGDVTPANLSLNNVLSSSNYGRMDISVALGSTPTKVLSRPIDERSVYFYEYNDKNYPVKVEGTDNYTITYKE